MGNSMMTKRFETVVCPICLNQKEIEIKYDLDPMNPYKCHHQLKHYLARIKKQDERNKWLENMCSSFTNQKKEVIEFCRKPSKETWGTLSTKIINMLGEES